MVNMSALAALAVLGSVMPDQRNTYAPDKDIFSSTGQGRQFLTEMYDSPSPPIKNQFFPWVLWKISFFEKRFRLIKKLPLVQFIFGSFESCPLPWAIDIGGGTDLFQNSSGPFEFRNYFENAGNLYFLERL